MANTKKTGVRALAWVLALAMLVLSIPVMAITAGAEEVNLLSTDPEKWTYGGTSNDKFLYKDSTYTFKGGDSEGNPNTYSYTFDVEPGKSYKLTGTLDNDSNGPATFTFEGFEDISSVTINKYGDNVSLDNTVVASGDKATFKVEKPSKYDVIVKLTIVAVAGGSDEPIAPTVTIDDKVKGGLISAIANGESVVSGETTLTAKTEVTLTAEPDTGYVFKNWVVTGAEVTDASALTTTFEMPENAVTVSAKFAKDVPALVIPDGCKNFIVNGDFSVSDRKADGFGWSKTGEGDPTIADGCIKFKSGNYNSKGLYQTVTGLVVGEEYTLTVYNVESEADVKMFVNSNKVAEVSAETTGSYEFTATPESVEIGFHGGDGKTCTLCNIALIGQDHSQDKFYNVTVDDKVEGGRISATPVTAMENTEIALTATPDFGYTFDEWIVTYGDDETVAVTENKFAMPAGDVNVSAVFVEEEPAAGDPYEVTFSGTYKPKDLEPTAIEGLEKKSRTNVTKGAIATVKVTYSVWHGDAKQPSEYLDRATVTANDTPLVPSVTIGERVGDNNDITLTYTFKVNKDIVVVVTSPGNGDVPTVAVSFSDIAEVENATYSAALVLHNDININLQMEGFGEGFDEKKLSVTVDDKAVETTYDESDATITCTAAEVQPDKMADEHTIAVSYNGVVAKEFTYSVRKYCDAVFKMCGEETDDPLYKLCVAVLNYGAWADKYVKELAEETEPTSDINAGYEITSFEEINKDKVVTDKLGTVGCIIDGGCSLELGSTITMNFFVNTAEAMPDPEKDILILNNEGNRVDPKNITVSEDSGAYTYVISVKNISASKLSRTYKLMFMKDMKAVYVDSDTIEQVAEKTTSYLQYSVYTYCDYVLDQTTDTTYTETLKTLCSALANYGEVAKAYEDSKKVVK